MRLCELFGCTLDELGDRMSSEEYTKWQALYSVAPFGDLRADIRQAQLLLMVGSMFRSKTAAPLDVMQFMPFERPPKKVRIQSREEIAEVMNCWMVVMNKAKGR